MVLWFIGIWYALWGSAFVRLTGKARIVGTAMILIAGFNWVDYVLARNGQTGISS